jgi:hypothetical protein
MSLNCITGTYNTEGMKNTIDSVIEQHLKSLGLSREEAVKLGALIALSLDDICKAENKRDIVSEFVHKVEGALDDRTKYTKREKELLIVLEGTEDAFDALPRFYKLNLFQSMLFVSSYGKKFNVKMTCTFELENTTVALDTSISSTVILNTIFDGITGFEDED